MFGLQFYGECWSGPDGEANYGKYNSSERCIMDFTGNGCDQNNPKECVGESLTNYVYRLKGKNCLYTNLDLILCL